MTVGILLALGVYFASTVGIRNYGIYLDGRILKYESDVLSRLVALIGCCKGLINEFIIATGEFAYVYWKKLP